MAKGFNVPIVHVNADDVEACSAAIRLAMAYRERWGRDIVIDVIGYRRYGHNETDEPAYTQPTIAAKIKAHPPVSEIYAEKLIDEGVIAAEDVEREGTERARGDVGGAERPAQEDGARRVRRPDRDDQRHRRTRPQRQPAGRDRGADRAACAPLNEALIQVPESFTIHRKLRKPLSKRIDALEEGGIEFGHAEALAFASLLTEGVHIRLTGQDTERGTFSHRHLVLHDENTGLKYCPMQNLEEAKRPVRALQQPALGDRLPRLRVRVLGGDTRTRWSSGRRSSATSPTPAR